MLPGGTRFHAPQAMADRDRTGIARCPADGRHLCGAAGRGWMSASGSPSAAEAVGPPCVTVGGRSAIAPTRRGSVEARAGAGIPRDVASRRGAWRGVVLAPHHDAERRPAHAAGAKRRTGNCFPSRCEHCAWHGVLCGCRRRSFRHNPPSGWPAPRTITRHGLLERLCRTPNPAQARQRRAHPTVSNCMSSSRYFA